MKIQAVNQNQKRQTNFGMKVKYVGDELSAKEAVRAFICELSERQQRQLMISVDQAKKSPVEIIIDKIRNVRNGVIFRDPENRENVGVINPQNNGFGFYDFVNRAFNDLRTFFVKLKGRETLSEPLTKGEVKSEKPYEKELLKQLGCDSVDASCADSSHKKNKDNFVDTAARIIFFGS